MFFAPPPHSQVTPPLTRDVLAPLGYQAGDFTYGVPAVWRWGEPATLVIGKYRRTLAPIRPASDPQVLGKGSRGHLQNAPLAASGLAKIQSATRRATLPHRDDAPLRGASINIHDRRVGESPASVAGRSGDAEPLAASWACPSLSVFGLVAPLTHRPEKKQQIDWIMFMGSSPQVAHSTLIAARA